MCDLIQESVLGRGGFGEVKKVKKDNKEYALKLFLSNIESSLTEIDVLMRVKSSNLIEGIELRKWTRECSQVFGQSTTGIVENLITGDIYDKNLKNAFFGNVNLRGSDLLKLKREVLTKFLCQTASALKCLSDADYYHMDVKPENIFYKAKPLIETADDIDFYVGDYGLCAALNNPSPNPSVEFLSGTPIYMDPELIQTSLIYETSPIWALGISALEMLSVDKWLSVVDDTIRARPRFNIMNNVLYSSQQMSIWSSKILTNFMISLINKVSIDEYEKWKEIRDLISEMVNIKPNQRPTPNQIMRMFNYDYTCYVDNKICELTINGDDLNRIVSTLLRCIENQNFAYPRYKAKMKIFCLALQYLLRYSCDYENNYMLQNLEILSYQAMVLAIYFYYSVNAVYYTPAITQETLVSYIFTFNNGHLFGNSLFIKSLSYDILKEKILQIRSSPESFIESFNMDFDDMLSLRNYTHDKDKTIDFFDIFK